MNEKDVSSEIFDLTLQITALAIKVSTETEHTVFVDYSGHVDLLSVRFAEGGWSPEKALDSDMVWLDGTVGNLEKLRGIKNSLRKLLRNGGNTDFLPTVESVVLVKSLLPKKSTSGDEE